MCCWFGLFDPVALHDLSLFIEAEKPGPARLFLPVEHRAVDHIVVLKHRLLKLTLCCEQFLRRQKHKGNIDHIILAHFARHIFCYSAELVKCAFLYFSTRKIHSELKRHQDENELLHMYCS